MIGPEMDASFGAVLRRYRLAACLTQEALARRAGLGATTIAALERNRHGTPHHETLALLGEAMALAPEDRAHLLAAAQPAGAGAVTPAPASSAARSTQEPTHPAPLPLPSTPLIGRDQELADLALLLQQSGTRLLTLTGAGGVGKTRLALALAASLAASYSDGVWLVELAALTDPALVPGAVLAALGLRAEAGRTPLATLTERLHRQRVLLVFDNCEHLILACATLVSDLLRQCAGLQVLATSREGLAVHGEHLYRVPSLAVPDPRQLPEAAQVAGFPAIRLFLARAQAQQPEFALSERNAPAVAEICARLDGIPLAIELAAARVGTLPVEALAARLDDRFRLLSKGPREVLPRQRTLRALLDWSYELLTPGEQALLRRLSVFPGGWTLEAAEAIGEELRAVEGQPGDTTLGVAMARPEPGYEARPVLDLLENLINKSLVLGLGCTPGEPWRYRLLETVRHYAAERLAEQGELTVTRRAHAMHYLALAEEAEPQLTGADQGRWLARLEAEHDNLRAALAWLREHGPAEQGQRLAAALWRFWHLRGHFDEGLRWLEALATGDLGAPVARAKALHGAGMLAHEQGDHERAAALLEQGLACWRALGDKQGIAAAINSLGNGVYRRGDNARAAVLFEESLAVHRELGDARSIATALSNLGRVARDRGDYGHAALLFEEGLAIRRTLGDTHGLAISLSNLGSLAYAEGGYEHAAALHEETLALWRDLGLKQGIAYALNNLGMATFRQGDPARAASLLEESLLIERELGDRYGIAHALGCLGMVAFTQGAYGRATVLFRESLKMSEEIAAREVMARALEGLSHLAGAQGQARRAAGLGGAAEALRDLLGARLPPDSRADHEAMAQAARATLGDEAFAAVWAAGRAATPEAAIAQALQDDLA